MLDAFSHFLPRTVLERFRELAPGHPALALFERLPELWDMDARLRSLEAFPDLQQILNFGNPPVDSLAPPPVAAELARLANTELASLCAAHPDRFPAFTAVLPMGDVDLALQELHHAHEQLGARGIQIFTNAGGRPLSDPEFRPVFEAMARLDLPILVHPYRTAAAADYTTEAASEDEVWFTFGWPYETSAFAARMVFSGIFDTLPDIKIVLHHFGAMLPMFANRLDLGFRQIFTGPGGVNPLAVDAGLKAPAGEHYRRFYADTALNGWAPGLRAGYEFFGPSHSLFGTDAPFCQDGGPSFISDTLTAIDALDLSPQQRELVLDGNARRLFRLPAPGGRGTTGTDEGETP
ncbi:amidohydrolase family protein [Streptomyces sp. NPDC059477]|uniref:amidohydrolase family protein n=1 Tax=Streptomyces sp. NPDC059477 TaxID=3346847 RepID=UPI0036B5BE65